MISNLVEGFLGEGSVVRCMRGISRYAGNDTPAVYLKGATSFQNRLLQATDLDARASRVNALHSLCRIVMEYHLLNMYLKTNNCHIIMAKSHLIV